jgi:sarcosine oxidase subunit beta
VSPLLAAQGFHRRGRELGVEYRFDETVTAAVMEKSGAVKVSTDRGAYHCDNLVIAPGADARKVGKIMGLDIPVFPDSHEGGITEPVAPFFGPMIVDLRRRPGTKNFYFYQNSEGQIVFCVTPEPIIEGTDIRSTSIFLPQVARRLIEVMPLLRNIKVRRTWRGLYPMSPDGVPLVDRVAGMQGVYMAVGFCGQGLMLGPGIGISLASLITGGKPLLSDDVFALFSSCRNFACVEVLK